MVHETTRERIIALLLAALVLLLGRAGAHRVGTDPRVERVLYLVAIGCLLAAVLIIVDDQR
jgi:ABC-type Fe3+-siderophore transport system permease subunit